MAIQAGHAADRLAGHAMLGLVKPGRRKLGHEKPQTFQLFGRDDAVKKFPEVRLSNFPAPRDVAKVGARGQEHRGRKFRQVGLGNVKVHVETLMLRVDAQPHLRKELMAHGV